MRTIKFEWFGDGCVGGHDDRRSRKDKRWTKGERGSVRKEEGEEKVGLKKALLCVTGFLTIAKPAPSP